MIYGSIRGLSGMDIHVAGLGNDFGSWESGDIWYFSLYWITLYWITLYWMLHTQPSFRPHTIQSLSANPINIQSIGNGK